MLFPIQAAWLPNLCFTISSLLELCVMCSSRISLISIRALILGLAIAALPPAAVAQRHDGGHGGSISGGSGRPTGLDNKDDLKDFHQALAVQATTQQIAEFQALVKTTEKAKDETRAFLQSLKNSKSEADASGVALSQSLENARTESKKFLDGFSAAQKNGLKEIAKRLAKSESDLDQEQKRLAASLQPAPGSDAASRAEGLDKALDIFSNEQLALGREMGIVLASGQDLAFALPPVKSLLNLSLTNQEKRSLAITVSGQLDQTAVANGQRTFKLNLISDLSDLQQNITEILRAQLDGSESCGERFAIRQASLTPSSPASRLQIKLHFERWTCGRSLGQSTSSELAESDGSFELKLTPSVDASNGLQLAAAFTRIDASGMLADALRTGSLGDDFRDRVSKVILSAMLAGTNFKTALPPAVQNNAKVQATKFQDAGIGVLSLVLAGQVEISNEQANQLASQLNQQLSAQAAPAQETAPK
jgi:hypothetical protein